MTEILTSLAIAGYRSFGKAPQYFEKLAKINILIGQNNAGKSNVLRFLSDIYALTSSRHGYKLDSLAAHLPDQPPMLLGVGQMFERDQSGRPVLPVDHPLIKRVPANHQQRVRQILGKLFSEKASSDSSALCWTLLTIPDLKYLQEPWIDAASKISSPDIEYVWQVLTNQGNGDRKLHWEPQVIRDAQVTAPSINLQLIPAIRRIGEKGSVSEGFDGTGIIERVAKLQNPDVHSQEDRKRFNEIRDFLREVVGRADATIEVPYERNTILIHMDGKVLPLESLGSGLHEVLILASAATVLQNHVVCIEEPELHLNPILQKKLLRYLALHTTNQYFITTHSAALMDTPGAEVYHIRLVGGHSVVERATSDEHRSAVCEDLGYHPSDLLQANCVIWVEGPSDRIYLNWWINSVDPDLIEGIHYSIMFYGGRLAAHLSNAPSSTLLNNFISLRRLNQRGAIVIDSDRGQAHARVNETKRRLQAEFDEGPGHAWITEGREIENYIPEDWISEAIALVHPKAMQLSPSGKFSSVLRIRSAKGAEMQALKVDIAKHIVKHHTPDLNVLDLKKRISSLQKFIRVSNPSFAQANGVDG